MYVFTTVLGITDDVVTDSSSFTAIPRDSTLPISIPAKLYEYNQTL